MPLIASCSISCSGVSFSRYLPDSWRNSPLWRSSNSCHALRRWAGCFCISRQSCASVRCFAIALFFEKSGRFRIYITRNLVRKVAVRKSTWQPQLDFVHTGEVSLCELVTALLHSQGITMSCRMCLRYFSPHLPGIDGLCIACYDRLRGRGVPFPERFPHYRILTLSDDALYLTVSGATSFLLTTHKKDQITVFSDPAFVNVSRSRIAPAIAVEMLQEIERRIYEQKGK